MGFIDREQLLSKFDSGALLFQPEVRKVIEEMPEAIIRCKDCKNRENSACFYSVTYINPEGYCHHAERKEDEAD